MAVLVSGGAGYVGSHTVRLLTSRGHKVVVLDDLSTGHRAAVAGVPLVVGDAADEALVREVVADHGVDAAIHFAAVKSVEGSVRDPIGYFEKNVVGSIRLLRALADVGVHQFVFSSSCAVYGSPDHLPVFEDSATRPDNPYGETKLAVERLLGWLDATGLRSVSLRYFNAAGAELDGSNGEDWRAAENLIPAVLRVAAGRQPAVRIFGTDYPTLDGTAIRDYVHVLDLAEGHALALEYLAGGGTSTVLNLGTGRGTSVREVVHAVERETGRPVPIEETARRRGDPAAIWAGTELAARILGFRARHGLDDIVGSAWRWHAAHPDGFSEPEIAGAAPS